MVTNDLGACEWFVWDLRRSGLIDRGQLDQIVGEFLKRNPRAEAPALAEFLVQQNTLTPFQAERILGGKTQGLVLGPYVLLDAIGQGSMGQVYKASSKNDPGLYAVKVLPRRSMWNVRLARRQVRSFGQFSHPAVVPFMDVGTAGGMHYLSWPLAEGQTVEALVHQQGRLAPAQAALIGMQLASGLAVCHQNNIFHGLLKPSNVMVGSDSQARILDFGIGSLLVENEGESLVDTMSTANTLTSGLDCASPESIMEPTNRTPAGDQYSLGCTLYFCLTGQVPFPEGSAVEKMMAHQTKSPTPIRTFAPDCPDGLAAVVEKLMAKNPEGRFSGCEELVEALEPYAAELAGSVAPMVTTPAPQPGLSSRPGGRPAPAAMGGGMGSRPSPSQPGRPSPFAAAPTPPRPAAPARPAAPPAPPAAGFGSQSFPPRVSQQTPVPPAPPPARGPVLPSRASFQLPPEAEVPLSAVGLPAGDQPTFSDPGIRSSTGWLTAPEEPKRGGTSGVNLGMIAAAVLLTALVFLGAMMLMKG